MAPEALAQVLSPEAMPPHPDLLVGISGAEDAGVLRLTTDLALVFTTDFFPPMVDEPFTFGQIAAANALSDVFAMGGQVLAALNLVGFPKDLDTSILGRILEGGASKVVEANGAVAGGHTVEDQEVKYGLAVTGRVHPDAIVRNRGLVAGDVLLLTKPLGTGLITSSIKAMRNDGPEVAEAIRWMSTLNSAGLDRILQAKPNAMTDVTGFGFLGHLGEMLAQDPLHVVLHNDQIPRIQGVEKCFHKKCRTKGGPLNKRYVGERLEVPPGLDAWDEELLLDPQTSGGLLMSLDPARAEALLPDLRGAGLEQAAIVGEIRESDRPRIQVV